MKSNPKKTKDAAEADEPLSLELERCQLARDKSRGRVEQLEGFFTHMADAVFVTGLDGQIIKVNLAACAMLGYEASELLGKHPWDFVTSAPRDEILGLIHNMEIGTPVAVQRIYRCKTGEQKLLDLRLTRFSHSKRDLIIASCRDITEQKRLEDRLRQSERNLAEGQRLTKTGSWILDFKTGNTDWSVETCRIFGFPDPPPSPHYSEFRARVRPEDRERVDQGLRESFETGEPQPLKYIFILPDGTRKNIETISQPVRDDEGKLKLMGTVMDVTERVKVQEALQKSEAYLTEAQCLSRTGSFSWKPASGEVFWSAETFRIFGFDPSVKPSLELARQRIHPDDAGMFADKVRRGMQEGKDLEYEHRLLMPDGTVKWLQVVARAARDESDKVEYIGALMDITERTQAAEALRAAEHLARGQLEALTDTLAVITQEPKPEKFLEHVLRVICQQLDATGVSVWENDSKFGCIHQVASFEENTLRLPAPDKIELIPQEGLGANPHPVWSDFFRDGNFCVYCRIDANPLRALVAKDPNGPWHDNFAISAPNLPGIKVCERISILGVKGTLIIPMLVAGKVTGFFSTRFNQMRPFRQEEIELTRAMSHQAMLAIQLIRLSQLSRESAIVAERNRMARDIHDTLAQGFTGIIMQLEAAKGSAERSDLAEIIKRIERAGELARSSLGEARRSVLALRPRSRRGVTLCMALEDLLKRMSDGSDLRAEFQVTGNEQALPVDWQEELLRIAQESLTNTIKHASARNFKATLNFAAKEVQLQLVDDGRGFDLRAEYDGFGLIGMKERVDRMNGKFILRSIPDEGTEILVILNNPMIPKSNNGNEQG
jgi:PAS domain S-box-containing protein